MQCSERGGAPVSDGYSTTGRCGCRSLLFSSPLLTTHFATNDERGTRKELSRHPERANHRGAYVIYGIPGPAEKARITPAIPCDLVNDTTHKPP
jgi:hypothetical protein